MRKAQAKLRTERHEGDTLYGFHNVQGLGEHAFRRFYLQKMATRFGVLGLAETKCGSPQDESDWARDFPNRKDAFWASSGRAAAGVALFISNRAGAKELKVEYRDPMARIIAVSGMFRGTRMVVVVIHAETLPEYQKGSHDEDQAAVFDRAKANIPLKQGYAYMWLMDTNNTPDRDMDYERMAGKPSPNRHLKAIEAMHHMLDHFGHHRTRTAKNITPLSKFGFFLKLHF